MGDCGPTTLPDARERDALSGHARWCQRNADENKGTVFTRQRGKQLASLTRAALPGVWGETGLRHGLRGTLFRRSAWGTHQPSPGKLSRVPEKARTASLVLACGL